MTTFAEHLTHAARTGRRTTVLLTCVSMAAAAQLNGYRSAEQTLPFTMTQVTPFRLPWRIAFLPDGRMLVTEKIGALWLVTQDGATTPVMNLPRSEFLGMTGSYLDNGGMVGVYVYATDHNIYLTYSEPGPPSGSSLALARARLSIADGRASLEELEVIWRDGARGRGGQVGGAVAFSPDGQFLFLALGDRNRITPPRDPDQPLGKILRLSLDGKPALGNPNAGKVGAKTVGIIDWQRDTEGAMNARVMYTYTFPGENLTPSETWSTGQSHALWLGVHTGRPTMGARARPGGWRRVESHRAGQELRLAARLVRPALQRQSDSASGHKARSDEAGPVLVARDRARQSCALSRRGVPAVERLGTDRRSRLAVVDPDHVRRQGRRSTG